MIARVSIGTRIGVACIALTLLGTGTGVAAIVSAGSAWIWAMLLVTLSAGGLAAYVVPHGVSRDLNGTADELREGAERIAAAAGRVTASSQSLAQGASQQAASLEETSASAQEISSMAGRNTENTRSVAEVVSASARKFQETDGALNQMVAAMREITGSSDKISKIIKVIDEIAFQTNILALNAAVEAARAGEAGMGFAVVADEVRNLAQRSAQAAHETSSLIEESIRNAAEGRGRVDQVVAAIASIRNESTRIKSLVDEVNQSSVEQARGIDQIGRAIAEMEQVTQKTAAGAEQSAAAAEELTAHSAALKQLVERLNAVAGQSSSPRPSAALRHRPNPRATPLAGKPVSGGVIKPQAAAPPAERPARVAPKFDRNEFPLDESFSEF